MKNRPSLLSCLLACLCFPLIELSAQFGHPIDTGAPQPIGPGSLYVGNYWNRTGDRNYSVHAIVGTNGSISMALYNHGPGIDTTGGIPGAVTNLGSGLVYASFGEAGYLKGRVHRSHRKIVGRLVLRTGDKVKVRRCVLEWTVPDPSHGFSVVLVLSGAVGSVGSMPPPVVTTNANELTLEEAEAIIELARRLELQNNPSTPILPPTPVEH